VNCMACLCELCFHIYLFFFFNFSILINAIWFLTKILAPIAAPLPWFFNNHLGCQIQYFFTIFPEGFHDPWETEGEPDQSS
jgi:hypothetical protein